MGFPERVVSELNMISAFVVPHDELRGGPEWRGCVKVEVDVLDSLRLIVRTVSVDIKLREVSGARTLKAETGQLALTSGPFSN